ncbi:hypothetical protein AGDE_01213 [Angomonas deanei]|uniref:Uncharacterized protein n=1 Tax=Angomonas deanei TaxID=59799 RepID=S9V944_9TRYP|nr:hypothetical protein AGDE_06606 [Angomonas deanei]EPY42710.1 hypothetical protein AGDE_01213 [Angomonas deanei]CAD2213398.1 hypothetical protein, conserved [Angomonas deanei]|eukprot:EPY37328.1 hypothetical protein AGDE_06606 [Angomonas deanei]
MGSITPEEHRLLLEEAVKLKADVSEVGCAKRKSCFAMQKDKRWHNAAVDKDDDLLLKRAYRNPQDPSYQKERARDYHRQQSILRYEKTLPRRRAVDPYVSLTGAQVDTRMTVPNQYTAAKLAEREGGKWVLDNPHRQQLSRKQPVMTRVMQGEYYNGQRVPNHRETDFIAANRADVRVASRLNHLRKECADR